MRNYGINYDTGLTAVGDCTRKRFDDAVVQQELQIIAGDLHATAVRVSGDDPQRLARAGQHALAAGLELWFSPVPISLESGALPGYFARCAREAERLRRAHQGGVVLVAVDAYRDADNAAGYRDALRAYGGFGKPVAVTEFGCCTYRGAADRGGKGWMIADEKSDPPLIPGTYERDEKEQVRHLHDILAVSEAEEIDSAFWFTLAGYEQPRHPTDPHRDLDLASYGVVAVLEHERGTTYPDMAWEPKQVFGALAAAYARARP